MSKRQRVRAGDGIEALAEEHGLFPRALWEHPDNAELRALRHDPEVLAPGDVVVIPDRRVKTVSVAAGETHVFRRRGVPVLFRLLLLDDEGRPRDGVAYRLTVDRRQLAGVTDEAGWLEQWIPARSGRGVLELDGTDECYRLEFGHLDPASTPSGAAARLHSLCYLDQPCVDEGTLARALARFQAERGIEPAHGRLDEQTQAELRKAYGI